MVATCSFNVGLQSASKNEEEVVPGVAEVTASPCINYSKTCTCESCVVSQPHFKLFHCRRKERRQLSSMSEAGHYPPPDFSCPPPDFLQPFQQQQQQQPSSSSFHPGMWSWAESPSEPSWDYNGQASWNHGASSGYGFQSGRGNYAPKRPYGEQSVTL